MNSQLILKGNSDLSLAIHVKDLLLTKGDASISECILSFQVSPDSYQYIDTEALFNLKPEVRGPLVGQAIHPSQDIQIKATLDPTLLSGLAAYVKNGGQAATYLQHLSQEDPDHPLLSTYSWYALEVTQQQDTGTVGYRTLWYYLHPADITPNGIDPEKMNQAMLNFTKEWSKTDNNSASGSETSTEDLISQSIKEMTQTFEELTQNLTTSTEEVVAETVQEMTQAFEELTENFSDIVAEIEDLETDISIYNILIEFFNTDNWSFQNLPDKSTLRLAFQGKNGQWNCYAKTREEQQQFIFYSICPVTIPEDKRQAAAEFITRANYGLLIGNFELNFDDGEIRYKTSIDVEGDTVSQNLIKQLVYTNVTTIDEYLPGIIAIVEGKLSPQEAIALIENQ